MADVTMELIKALAEANGLHIPDERLELVQRQYQAYLRVLEEIGRLELPRETEPSILFTLAAPEEGGR